MQKFMMHNDLSISFR